MFSSHLKINPFWFLNPLNRVRSKTMMSWRCSVCTLLNPSPSSSTSSQSPTCRVCLSVQPPSVAVSSLSQSAAPLPTKPKWSCKACTFLNPYDSTSCEVCGTRVSASLVSRVEVDDDEVDGALSAVGNVFMPLRGCSSRRNKREVVEIFEGFDKENETKGLGILESEGFGKVVENEPDIKKIVCKGFGALKACSSGENKRKVVERGNSEGFDDSGDGFRTLKRKVVDSGVLKEMKVDKKDDEKKAGNKPLKIMTYNVWFAEEVELHKRMQAIGDLIQLHSPDIICFQEVTPDIYEALRQSSWWKLYHCSVDSALAGGYYCIQLSRLPVKSYYCKPFTKGAMGRQLLVAELNLKEGVPLVVATSHLESPTPGPPTWDQMWSKDRVAQAKEAISHLGGNPNVVFCGDMNWTEKHDGPFPLPNGWVDAWVKLMPSENGWTYDTKANKMLTGQRLLQLRLDRFVCNLRDFEISKIEMIGMEEIPGAVRYIEKKVKSVMKTLTNPVLPSDHFGLVLTICRRNGSSSESG